MNHALLAFIGRGTPLSPVGCLCIGSLFAILGLHGIVLAFLPKPLFIKHRGRWKGGAEVSRIGKALTSLFPLFLGALMVTDGYFGIHFSPAWVLGSAFALAMVGVSIDGIAHWRRNGFANQSLCTHCRKNLSFRIYWSKCPNCGADLL